MPQRKWQLCANCCEAKSLQGVQPESVADEKARHATPIDTCRENGGLAFSAPLGLLRRAGEKQLFAQWNSDGATVEATFMLMALRCSFVNENGNNWRTYPQ